MFAPTSAERSCELYFFKRGRQECNILRQAVFIHSISGPPLRSWSKYRFIRVRKSIWFAVIAR
jgi:hypothetical protein